jgi:hypothetical protein
MEHEEVIISDTAFDVSADNYEDFDQEINPAKLGKKLIQTNTLKGSVRKYQFYASRHLLLNFVEKKNARIKNFRVDLAWLSSEPEHSKVIVWKWLYFAIAAGSLAGLCLYLALAQIIELRYCVVAGTITLTTTLIFFLIFIYLMRDEYIFKSYYGNAKLFLIENKKPNQSEFDSFFINLQQSIDSAQSNITTADRLVGELKMCRRLRDEKIIDDETYTRARTIIFKHDQYKS